MQIPILLYHSNNVAGNDYVSNDHVALRDDLATIAALGYEIESLHDIAQWSGGNHHFDDETPRVGLSFDDGSAFDFYDLDHPTWGVQRSFLNILRDFADDTGRRVHATSFVIAGDGPREELDRTCLAGLGWWGDEWWLEAQESGLMSIENHSWDHNHPTLSQTCQRAQDKGRFDSITTQAECEAEVAQASRYIAQLTGRSPTLFAYPWGQASAYLREAYLPDHANSHGIEAAYAGGEVGYVAADSDQFYLPRMICGHNWRTPQALSHLLRAAMN